MSARSLYTKAQKATKANDFSTAIATFEKLINDYENTFYAEQAETELSDVRDKQAQAIQKQRDPDNYKESTPPGLPRLGLYLAIFTLIYQYLGPIYYIRLALVILCLLVGSITLIKTQSTRYETPRKGEALFTLGVGVFFTLLNAAGFILTL